MTDRAALAAACLTGTLKKDPATNEWVVLGGPHGEHPFRYQNWKPALVHWAYFHDRDWYNKHWGNPNDRLTW